MTWETASIEGRLTDAGGGGFGGVRVIARIVDRKGTWFDGADHEQEVETVSSESGDFRIPGAPVGGNIQIILEIGGKIAYAQTITIVSGKNQTDIMVK
jgi:hypothetical protein